MKYKLVVGGGTFDHLHKGHEAFLRAMLSVGDHILLGITSDEYLRHKQASDSIQFYDERKQAVRTFFQNESAEDRISIAPIDSMFYPQGWEALPIEAIIATDD